MSTMVKEIYEAFKSAGVDDELAAAAAQAVPSAEDLATKGDIAELKGELAELKGEFAELKGDFAGLRGEIANVYRHMWLMGASLLAAMIGLKFFD